jgi:peptidoglycan-N-acetylglucosamine deacetylase
MNAISIGTKTPLISGILMSSLLLTASLEAFAQTPSSPPPSPAPTTRASAIKFTRGNPDLKEVALTIDDGPLDTTATDKGTKANLAALEAEQIKATFFLIGSNAKQYPALVKAIRDAGHSIGNHTANHTWDRGMPNLSPAERRKEIEQGKEMIEEALGGGPIDMPLFRLPQGAGINNAAINALIGEYHTYDCFWSIDTEDWKGGGADQTTRSVLESDQLEGSVILCHDIAKGTPQAIRRFAKELKARGYKFVTMEQLIEDSKDKKTPTPSVD